MNVIINGLSSMQKAARAAKYRQVAQDVVSGFSTRPNSNISPLTKKIQELTGRYSTEIKTLKIDGKDVEFVTYAGSQQGSNPGKNQGN